MWFQRVHRVCTRSGSLVSALEVTVPADSLIARTLKAPAGGDDAFDIQNILDVVVEILCLAGWAVASVRAGPDQPSASAFFS